MPMKQYQVHWHWGCNIQTHRAGAGLEVNPGGPDLMRCRRAENGRAQDDRVGWHTRGWFIGPYTLPQAGYRTRAAAFRSTGPKQGPGRMRCLS